tara:strand:- start:373 stop:681 length:309 start_codon:yes stop_codon:yes gene_type:complete
MIKIIATLPFFFTTLFIPSNINATLIPSNNEFNNNFRNSNLLISYGGGGGGGGGGGNSPKDKAKRKARQEKVKLIFKKRQAIKKATEGKPLTAEEKIILGID